MPSVVKKILSSALAFGVVLLLIMAFLPSPIPVEVVRVEKGPLRVTVDEDGETRVHDRFMIAAPISGRLMRIELHDGDEVQLDQLLAEIAPLPLSAREREEQLARVKAAEALQKEADERLQHAQADFEFARRETERLEPLAKTDLVSKQELDGAKNIEITARNELDAARFRAQATAADVKIARAGLMALETTKGKTPPVIKIVSPVTGRILRIFEKSEHVVTSGAPLMTLGDPAQLEVVLDVLSTEAVKVKPGMPVILNGWGGNQPLRANVRIIEPFGFMKVSALGIEEQRVNIVADFVDPPGPLGDGYRVEGHIVIWEQDNVLKIPASSLFRTGQRWSVFVTDGGRARRRAVDVGHRSTLEAEILRGLEVGQEVIRHPSNQIEDGTRIVPQ